jgi:ATP-dependent exoDNAse (exonuclease V) beta subunit
MAMPSLRPVFARTVANIEVRTEWRFDTVTAGRWLTGSFDRVALERNVEGRVVAAVIYDFKTDEVRADQVSARAGQYERQLTLYGAALARMLGLETERIRLQLVFTHPGVVREVA